MKQEIQKLGEKIRHMFINKVISQRKPTHGHLLCSCSCSPRAPPPFSCLRFIPPLVAPFFTHIYFFEGLLKIVKFVSYAIEVCVCVFFFILVLLVINKSLKTKNNIPLLLLLLLLLLLQPPCRATRGY